MERALHVLHALLHCENIWKIKKLNMLLILQQQQNNNNNYRKDMCAYKVTYKCKYCLTDALFSMQIQLLLHLLTKW